jgi:hypothetical protein
MFQLSTVSATGRPLPRLCTATTFSPLSSYLSTHSFRVGTSDRQVPQVSEKKTISTVLPLRPASVSGSLLCHASIDANSGASSTSCGTAAVVGSLVVTAGPVSSGFPQAASARASARVIVTAMYRRYRTSGVPLISAPWPNRVLFILYMPFYAPRLRRTVRKQTIDARIDRHYHDSNGRHARELSTTMRGSDDGDTDTTA